MTQFGFDPIGPLWSIQIHKSFRQRHLNAFAGEVELRR